MDSVADRDFAVEFLSCAAILMMHISRIAEEMVRWSSEEFRFVELRDAFTTGSSIMPQKKNPRCGGADAGQDGQGLRESHEPSDDNERPSAHLQQGHAGGQGAGLRHGRHVRNTLTLLPNSSAVCGLTLR